MELLNNRVRKVLVSFTLLFLVFGGISIVSGHFSTEQADYSKPYFSQAAVDKGKLKLNVSEDFSYNCGSVIDKCNIDVSVYIDGEKHKVKKYPTKVSLTGSYSSVQVVYSEADIFSSEIVVDQYHIVKKSSGSGKIVWEIVREEGYVRGNNCVSMPWEHIEFGGGDCTGINRDRPSLLVWQ